MIHIEQVPLRDVGKLDDAELLRKFQRTEIVVLDVALGDCKLDTLISIAPKGRYFGQEWWVGQSYVNWAANLAANRDAAKDAIESVRSMGIAFKGLPMQIFSVGGWFYHAFGKSFSAWNTDVVISLTVPSSAVSTAVQAMHASLPVVSEYLLPRAGSPSKTKLDGRYGEILLEQAFPISSLDGMYYRTMYQRPGESEATQQLISNAERKLQQGSLAQQKKALQTVRDESRRGRTACDKAHRQQFLFFLNALEIDPVLHRIVREINSLRAEVLVEIGLPHFFSSLWLRVPDLDNKPRKVFDYLPNDSDWLAWLSDSVPTSFASGCPERALVATYLTSLRMEFPCLGTDPFEGMLKNGSRKVHKPRARAP